MLNHLYALSIKVRAGPMRLLGEGSGAAVAPRSLECLQGADNRGVEMVVQGSKDPHKDSLAGC